LYPTTAELRKRYEMLAACASQPEASNFVNSRMGTLPRSQPTYDYLQLPHPGPLNCEAWQWPMAGAEVCEAF